MAYSDRAIYQEMSEISHISELWQPSDDSLGIFYGPIAIDVSQSIEVVLEGAIV